MEKNITLLEQVQDVIEAAVGHGYGTQALHVVMGRQLALGVLYELGYELWDVRFFTLGGIPVTVNEKHSEMMEVSAIW